MEEGKKSWKIIISHPSHTSFSFTFHLHQPLLTASAHHHIWILFPFFMRLAYHFSAERRYIEHHAMFMWMRRIVFSASLLTLSLVLAIKGYVKGLRCSFIKSCSSANTKMICRTTLHARWQFFVSNYSLLLSFEIQWNIYRWFFLTKYLFDERARAKGSLARDTITQHNEKLISHICVNNEISYSKRSVSYGTFNVMLGRASEAKGLTRERKWVKWVKLNNWFFHDQWNLNNINRARWHFETNFLS